jgi:hypothetical protein
MLLAQHMLARITAGIHSSVQADFDRAAAANIAPAMDAECVAKYCGLVYNFILFYPAAVANVSAVSENLDARVPHCSPRSLFITIISIQILTLLSSCRSDNQSDSLLAIVRIQAMCLGVYKERDVVRAVLQITQSFFSPATSKAVPYQANLLAAGCTMGRDIVARLFQSLCGDLPSSLWPNLGDTILSIISGCEGMMSADCKQWVRSALFESGSARLESISLDLRETAYAALFRLAQNNNRRFKSLIQDIAKICASEMTPDSLLLYQD